jgi:hypothetical protein
LKQEKQIMDEKNEYPLSLSEPEDEKEPEAAAEAEEKPETAAEEKPKKRKRPALDPRIMEAVYAVPNVGDRRRAEFRMVYAGPMVMPPPVKIGRVPSGMGDNSEGMRDGPGESSVVFCTECGAKLPGYAKYCTECG